MRPSVKIAIQYEPQTRGLYLALGYCRVRRRSGRFFDLYGVYEGYCGGGAYGDAFFHAGEQVGVGFTSFTTGRILGTPSGGQWDDDIIGVSGIAGQEFADGVREVLRLVADRLYTRWCCSTDDGLPDLRPEAKKRLNCERRRVFYTSPGFDENLLPFLSTKWGISLQFGRQQEEFDRSLARMRARHRLRRKAFLAALVKYPQLIETGLRLLASEPLRRCGRAKVTFMDKRGQKLVVITQWESLNEQDVERIVALQRELRASTDSEVRLTVATSLDNDSAVRSALHREGISWREIGCEELIHFLTEAGDSKLTALLA